MLLLASATPDKTTTFFIIGDSTAANKDISGGKQERGWGMVLQSYFEGNDEVTRIIEEVRLDGAIH